MLPDYNYRPGNSFAEVTIICGFVVLFTVASFAFIAPPLHTTFNYINRTYAIAMQATNSQTVTPTVPTCRYGLNRHGKCKKR